MNEEVCICSAVLTEDHEIFIGKRHLECLQKIAESGKIRLKNSEVGQGFMTSSGRFVTRKEGRILQENAGIPSKVGYRLDLLFSEDLY